MKITIYPATKLGSLLLSWGLIEPTVIELKDTSKGMDVVCNKKILHKVELTFNEASKIFSPKISNGDKTDLPPFGVYHGFRAKETIINMPPKNED